MSVATRLLFGVTLAGVSLANVARAEEPLPPSLELFGLAGPSLVAGEPGTPDTTESFRRVGVYGELGLGFRSRYFIDPFLSVGYGTLASGDTELPDGPWGAGGTLSQRLDVWLISPGVTADLWRFRLRLGLGLAVVVQHHGFRGDDSSTTQLPIAEQLGLGFNLYESRGFRLDVESKLAHAAGADITFGVLGVTVRGDVVVFD